MCGVADADNNSDWSSADVQVNKQLTGCWNLKDLFFYAYKTCDRKPQTLLTSGLSGSEQLTYWTSSQTHWRASEWGVKTRRYIKVFNIRGVSLALLLPLFHLQNYKLLSYIRCEFYLSEPTRHIPSGPLTCLPEEEVFPLVFSLPLPSSPHCHLLATAREEKASSLRGRKKRLPLGCFLWQAWQNNQPSHYGICKQW